MTTLREYVKVAEAALILGVSQNTVRAWAENCIETRRTVIDYSGEWIWNPSLQRSRDRNDQNRKNRNRKHSPLTTGWPTHLFDRRNWLRTGDASQSNQPRKPRSNDCDYEQLD